LTSTFFLSYYQNTMDQYYDFIVVGSGIAGLSAALKLSKPDNSILIISKSSVRESATKWAQGGIAVAMEDSDTSSFHFEDTIEAGAGLCDETAVRVLVEEGQSRVKELIEMGASFDRDEHGFSLTKEGAHRHRRILHAGDATGKEIEKALGNTLLSKENVTFLQNCFVHQLLCKDGECYGVLVEYDGQRVSIGANAVILATGGVGQLYSHNSNPPIATGDGIALAFNAGAPVTDMEFIQFHPTTLYTGDKKPISIFLISEALRGEGALLRNSKGERFMSRYHPLWELAPRDVVSRAIYQEMKRLGDTHVFLDLSHLEVDIPSRFPTIYARCLEAKIDIRSDFIPVAPAAHYFMGGVDVDLNSATIVDRLYACGELASLGLHGANRLASNSLLDGLVFGHRAAVHALSLDKVFHFPVFEFKEADSLPIPMNEILTIKYKLRDMMWKQAGIIRNESGLNALHEFIDESRTILSFRSYDKVVVEIQNMLTVAALISRSATIRTESRGAHFRDDYPEINDNEWQSRIVQFLDSTILKRPLKPALHLEDSF